MPLFTPDAGQLLSQNTPNEWMNVPWLLLGEAGRPAVACCGGAADRGQSKPKQAACAHPAIHSTGLAAPSIIHCLSQ